MGVSSEKKGEKSFYMCYINASFFYLNPFILQRNITQFDTKFKEGMKQLRLDSPAADEWCLLYRPLASILFRAYHEVLEVNGLTEFHFHSYL